MTGSLTGVGNYSLQLLLALINDYPELDYFAFGRVESSFIDGWSYFDRGRLLAIAEQGEGEAPNAPVTPRGFGATIRRFAKQSSTIRSIYHVTMQSVHSSVRLAVQTRTFARTAASLDLFHALNFIPPHRTGVATLPIVYDLSFIRHPAAHSKARLKWLERLPGVIENAPLIQTISEFSRNEIASFYRYPKDRIFVAYPAPANIFRPVGFEQTQRGLAPFDLSPGRYLLAVGTLEPRKNLNTLIAAYARLPQAERSRVPLVIAGGAGWGNLNLPHQTAELVRDGSLRFLGMVPNAALRDLYEGAIALLFPSVYEGFGMPVVEAMSCGTPAIHSRNTSMDEITAGLGATTLPAIDVDAWTDGMREAIEGVAQSSLSDRQKQIDQARRFDWATSAARVRAAYATLVK